MEVFLCGKSVCIFNCILNGCFQFYYLYTFFSLSLIFHIMLRVCQEHYDFYISAQVFQIKPAAYMVLAFFTGAMQSVSFSWSICQSWFLVHGANNHWKYQKHQVLREAGWWSITLIGSDHIFVVN